MHSESKAYSQAARATNCIVAIAIMLGPLSLAYGQQTISSSAYYSKATQALNNRHLDSAFNYFTLAFSAGMSKDSLLYGWGEIYLAKGVYDTALALNFSIKGSEEKGFRQKVLEQRYMIYAALGWEEKAQETLDSLRKETGYRTLRFAPLVQMNGTFGYTSLQEVLAGVYPWSDLAVVDTTDIEHGIHAGLATRLRWNLGNKDRFSLDIGGSVAKPYYVEDNVIDSVKLDMQVFVQADARNILERLAVGGRIGVRRNYAGDVSAKGLLDLTCHAQGPKWMRAFSAGYALEVSQEREVDNQNVWLFGYLDNAGPLRQGFTFSLFANGYFARMAAQNYDAYAWLYYVDDAREDFVVHYTDETYSARIDTAGKAAIAYVSELVADTGNLALLSAIYGDSIHNQMPQSHISLGPEVVYSFSPAAKLRTSIGAGWNVRYYPAEYHWVGMWAEGLDAGQGTDILLAFSRADSSYYFLDEQIVLEGGFDYGHVKEHYTPFSFAQRSRKRIDNTISVNLSLESEIWRMGVFVVSGTIARTWSTLGDDCPIDVPEFSWSAQLKWTKTIRPRMRQRR